MNTKKVKKAIVPKDDNKDRIGKIRPSLLLPEFLFGIIKVLTNGALKYEAYSWQKVKDPIESYSDAVERHWIAFRMGEQIDKEWGFHHLFHMTANVMFLWWHSTKAIKSK